jgi:hypothetical protein
MRKIVLSTTLAALLIYAALPLVCFSQVLVSTDGMGSIWTISGSKVQKLNSQGISICEYSNRIFGEPSHIDASDPFRILIFYSLPQVVVVVNSNAEELGVPFQLNMLSIGSIGLVCRSNQGGFWAFSAFKNRLVHVDNSFSPSGQHINLGKLQRQTNPSQIIESNGVIYLGYENRYISRIDLYGDNSPTIEIPHSGPFSINRNELWVTVSGKIFSYSLSRTNSKLYELSCNCSSLPVINQTDTVCISNKKVISCQKKEL